MINVLCMLMEDLVAVYVGFAEKFTDASKFKHHNILPIIYMYIYIYTHIISHTHIIYVASALFDAGKPWWICKSLVVHQIVNTIQNLKLSCDINEESKQAEIHQSFTTQKFLMGNLPKFSPANNLHYTVVASTG